MSSGVMRGKKPYRQATLAERRGFYEKEFSLREVYAWFSGRALPQLCVVDAGSETGIIVDKKFRDTLFYFPLSELIEKLGKYVPEDVYYDRSRYVDCEKVLETMEFRDYVSQELVFDLDVDNIKCSHHEAEGVCDKCVSGVYGWTLKMVEELRKDFKKIRIVYSGRGFHIHVLDKKAFLLTVRERERLNERFSAYPIDPWVSRGYIRLIRMPYTLNGLVSRVVKPVDTRKRFSKGAYYPRFL